MSYLVIQRGIEFKERGSPLYFDCVWNKSNLQKKKQVNISWLKESTKTKNVSKNDRQYIDLLINFWVMIIATFDQRTYIHDVHKKEGGGVTKIFS